MKESNKTAVDRISDAMNDRGGLYIAVVFLILLFGMLFLTIWVNEISKKTGVNTFELQDRILKLEREFSLSDELNTDFLSDTDAQFQFLEKEIRKLWDLSNKRNRKNIEKIIKSMSNMDQLISNLEQSYESLSTAKSLLINDLKSLEKTIGTIDLSDSDVIDLKLKLGNLEKKILIVDETIQAYDTFRQQTNQTLTDIQSKIYTDVNVIE